VYLARFPKVRIFLSGINLIFPSLIVLKSPQSTPKQEEKIYKKAYLIYKDTVSKNYLMHAHGFIAIINS